MGKIKAIDLKCPTCGAPRGVRCFGTVNWHWSRLRKTTLRRQLRLIEGGDARMPTAL